LTSSLRNVYIIQMAMGTTVDRRTLRERTSDLVRELIISGVLKPGEAIVETRLCEELGVSRTPLREALRGLEAQGLLVGDGRGHLSVRSLDSRQVLEVFEVRAALEVVAATKLAERRDRLELAAELRKVLEPLKDHRLNFATQIATDLGFHLRMCEMTGNQTLVESWQRLIGQLQMVIIATGPGRASSRMRYDEHEVIVAAIERGDVANVTQVLREHMDSFCRAYVSDAIEREIRD
jgi:DNA-binding GntR family transcriptional regulator